MGISYRPTGEAAAVGTAGELVGKSEARKESQRQAERQQEISLREAAQNRAYQWEVEKMLLNSQQDFAHEQRMRQVELDREARAHEWETEKMEIASRFDFEQEEKERLRRKAMLTSGMETINNSDAPDPEKAKARFELKRQFLDVTGYEEALGYERPKNEPRAQSLSQQRREMEAIVGHLEGEPMETLAQRVAAAYYDPDTLQKIQLTGEKVLVESSDGELGYLDKAEMELPYYQKKYKTVSGFRGHGETGGW